MMRNLYRTALALLAGATVLGCAPASPAPDASSREPVGVAFPTWHVGAEGAAALLEGRLAMIGRCLYLVPPQGPPFLVIWPDTVRLAVVDDTPAIVDGSRVVASVGERVRLGGGELTKDLWPEAVAGCDTSQVWGANSINP